MEDKQSSEVQNESIPPKLALHEIPGLVLSFFLFYRGIIFAIAILIGLYCVIQMSRDRVSSSVKRDRNTPSFESVGGGETSLGNTPFLDSYSSSDLLIAESQDRSSSRTKGPSLKTQGSTESLQIVRFRKLLKESTVDELIRYSRDLFQGIEGKEAPRVIKIVSQSRKIVARLREMDLTPDQVSFTNVSELEAMSVLDAFNVQQNIGLGHTRDNLIRCANRLLENTDPKVLSKANLALLVARAVDVLVTPTEENHEQLREQYALRIDAIMLNPDTTAVVARLMIRLSNESDVGDLLDDFVSRCLTHPNEDLHLLGVVIAERQIFEDLNLESLVGRMSAAGRAELRDIDQLFSLLAEHPGSRPVIFQIALMVIDKHLSNGDQQEANQLIERLREIEPTIVIPEAQQLVAEKMNLYEQEVGTAVYSP